MRVDRFHNTIEWYKKGLNDSHFYLIGGTTLPKRACDKDRLYIAITFYSYDDAVRVLS